MTAYYNENDPKAAAWLRELVYWGLIADGEVDERSIEDVTPNDLRGFTQCHFFAGIGGWSYALRLAGWPDDRPVWTGSCPCQPFSQAGKSGGFADERHLWPAFFYLIVQCRPTVVFGEQVASPNGLAWLDLVQTDLEGEGYAAGAADLCAAGVGAPHIRQRLYWMADSNSAGRFEYAQRDGEPLTGGQKSPSGANISGRSKFNRLALPESEQPHGRGESRRGRGQPANGSAGSLVDDRLEGRGQVGADAARSGARGEAEGLEQRPLHGGDVELDIASSSGRQGGRYQPAHGKPVQASAWTNCQWIPCRDGKARPIEPGTLPLAHGVSGRVGLLRGYGNAIVPQVAAEFIGAYLDAI